MRVAFLAAANSIHTVRWVNGLAAYGVEVHLISAHTPDPSIDPQVSLHSLPMTPPLAYLFGQWALRACLERIQPDLVNAHYATGYGLLARLARCQPLLLSVWGSDVYDFPHKSSWHRHLLRRNLCAATALASTSHCMARRALTLCPGKPCYITPFGVDETRFVPSPGVPRVNELVVGTVKALEPKYGVDTLLRAFAWAVEVLDPTIHLRLEIAGDGSQEAALRALAAELGVATRVVFHGKVAHTQVPALLQQMDIFVALSREDSESFGVAAVEAGACGLPVLVSDAEGLAEVVLHEQTGLIVPRDDVKAGALALVRLAGDAVLRERLGQAGRRHVQEHYTWAHSLEQMVAAYRSTLAMQKPVNMGP
jgi:glycosyltransferase involved in cell wall biosynthesis